MELSNIKKLLDNYLEAETSLAEEKELEAYFLSGNVAPELEEYIPLFSFLKSERNISASDEIEFKMPFEEKKPIRFSIYKWVGIAASIAIIASVFLFRNHQKNTLTKAEPVAYELAMQNTQDLLLMMTDAVVNGKKQLSYLKEINQTKNQLINK
ncbi:MULTISPECIES: hypothetical protein [Mesonia]|uniref:Uncharacterized protein n=1 Tax=Mesonia oceanica TaxID=2687242 RepID=A0AC61Y6X5_9FLAO|nr:MULTISPECIES: hypothetical protein [Mesonia]MAN28838.1 hypothetical protein [Mesonia sp.]MAQ40415.1 hypothetical protein [Mesonia sp.]MBJ98036.1 hypothetical protein [Flavobacteriaceae bacterium]VVV00252.1 hypothetical protein FVB9532_01518 [Mesonia oceanica]|tara:strand:- start:9021 stop:9482 length:462 start_codon:yes stop_codon:yes gene_type:complete